MADGRDRETGREVSQGVGMLYTLQALENPVPDNLLVYNKFLSWHNLC